MKENFEQSIVFVLRWEGDYSNDPNDTGKETRWGISKRAYPDLDIKNLTISQAKEIYKRDYWDKAGCDDLPYPLDIVVFDTAVNMGISRAQIFLNNAPGRDWQDVLFQRINFYSKLAGAKYYLRGWINRVMGLYHLIKQGG